MDTTLIRIAADVARDSVIYVAIGSPQGHYDEDEHSAQQYPPFLTNWSPLTAERHVILIDPALEDPPCSLTNLVLTADNETLRRITFHSLKMRFHWTEPAHYAFLSDLIRIVIASPTTYLILQDYTGHGIRSEYWTLLNTTFRNDAPSILSRVLFDPSYGSSGGFHDLTIPVLRSPTCGAFLQPDFISLRHLVSSRPAPAPSTIRYQQEMRSALIRYYAGRLLRSEFADRPAVGDDALQRLQFFAPIVDYTPTADPPVLRRLIADTLRDFGSIVTPPRTYTDAAVAALLADGCGNALNLEFHDLTSC